MNQPEGLIEILLDKAAREDERDDAAIYLGKYVCDKTEIALSIIATDDTKDEMVVDSCGESLARIWVSRNKINKDLIKKCQK